jgi:cellulose synthase/poly-beta-1,6-N-acetylglucosamine synthase-like glycosyltransferase
MFVNTLLLTISLMVSLFFFLYGFNHYFLISATRKYKKPILPVISGNHPHVSIHLPVYNERYVIRRLVEGCTAAAQSYGMDCVNIKIMDDSNDDTAIEIDKLVDEYQQKHFNIEVIRRDNKSGFKAGALQAALESTEEEFIAIFDADFVPAVDFLNCTLPYFSRDERLGIIQSRWTHLNRDYNLLTRAIAVSIDVHFLIEQTGRYAAGCLQNFNGSGGVLRKKAILEAGGWQSDTLAEDLDLSYRMQNLGYRVLFLKDLQSPGEIPQTIPSYKKQQGRWACGSLRTARKILPELILNQKIGLKQRLQAFIHLTSYLLHPMMLFSFIMICLVTLFDLKNAANYNSNPLMVTGYYKSAFGFVNTMILKSLGWDFLLTAIVVCFFAPWISMIASLKAQNLSISRNLISMLLTFLIGFGLSSNNTIEAGKALFTNRVWDFTRTPKYADKKNEPNWKKKNYQVQLDFSWMMELALICLGGVSIGIGVRNSNTGALVFLVPYTAAYILVFSLTLLQSRKEKVA